MLKPQDVLVAVALLDAAPDDRRYARLAERLGISASEAHAALDRAALSGLVDRTTRTVRRAALREFLLHGLKYCFPGERTGVTRGVPTSIAAPPLREHFTADALPPVWPHPKGAQRGEGLVPLYRSVPEAARRDEQLYEWFALLDAVRAGRARERQLAKAEIRRRTA